VTVIKARSDSHGETKIVTIRDPADLPEAEHQSPAFGTQSLSVVAARNGDRTAESNVMRGYNLFPDCQEPSIAASYELRGTYSTAPVSPS
jgi:hypothetical protein